MGRGQAALEFLMTYGWALLVILVMIGALAYFGVLNPKPLLPEKCVVTTGLDCADWKITKADSTAKVYLTNNLGSTIERIVFTSPSCGTRMLTLGVTSGTKFEMSCTITNLDVASGDKFRMPLTFNYTLSGKPYSKMAYGELFATVQ